MHMKIFYIKISVSNKILVSKFLARSKTRLPQTTLNFLMFEIIGLR